MDGNPEIERRTSDCANCPTCRAFRMILEQFLEHGEANLLVVAAELAEWLATEEPGIEAEVPGAQLDSRCVMDVARTADWLRTATKDQILERARDVGLGMGEMVLLELLVRPGCGMCQTTGDSSVRPGEGQP